MKRGRQGDGGGRPIKWDEVKIEDMADSLERWMDSDEDHFWLKEWAIENRIPPAYISIWADKNDRFYKALDRAKAQQEVRLAKGAMLGAFNAYMTGLALKNVAGWRDREPSKVDVSKDGESISISIDV